MKLRQFKRQSIPILANIPTIFTPHVLWSLSLSRRSSQSRYSRFSAPQCSNMYAGRRDPSMLPLGSRFRLLGTRVRTKLDLLKQCGEIAFLMLPTDTLCFGRLSKAWSV
jgi:hypothetical protein